MVSIAHHTVTIRMPVELFKWLEKYAATEHRSVNQQILKFIEDKKKEETATKK
jgi:hypothetical protein